MNLLNNHLITILQCLFALFCLFLFYSYGKKIKSYEFYALTQKIALNDKMAHFNFSLGYFKRFYLFFKIALIALVGIVLLEFMMIENIYLNHFINFILIFTGILYLRETKYIHELSRQSMLKILLLSFACVNTILAALPIVILPQNVHIQHDLLYLHLMMVAASLAFVLSILMHSAVMLTLKKALKNISTQSYANNNAQNQSFLFFKRDDFPSIQAMETIFLKRLNYLFWALSLVLLTGTVLILDLHANAITATTETNAIKSLQNFKIPQNSYSAIPPQQSHFNYLPFYLKLAFSFALWLGILALKIYQKRYGLAISKMWYMSLVLATLWLMSYLLSYFWL